MSIPISTSPAASRDTRWSIFGSWGITIGGSRSGTSGRWSGCCSTIRTGGSARRISGSTRFANGTGRSRSSFPTGSRFTTAVRTSGAISRRSFYRSVEVEIARRLRDRFLARLSQRFLEALGERVAARALVLDRFREDRFPARRRVGQDAFGVAEFRLVLVLRLDVPHHPPQVRVDHEYRPATRARHVEFRFEFRHWPLAPSIQHSTFSIQHCYRRGLGWFISHSSFTS